MVIFQFKLFEKSQEMTAQAFLKVDNESQKQFENRRGRGSVFVINPWYNIT